MTKRDNVTNTSKLDPAMHLAGSMATEAEMTKRDNVTNTSKLDPVTHLAGSIAFGSTPYIEGMERLGQHELLESEQIPTKMLTGTDADLVALGFVLGQPCVGDPIFRDAKLPPGWRREGGEHAMWSYIVDENGLERCSIFYKAAFYDRSAHLSVSRRIRVVRDYCEFDAGRIIVRVTASMPKGQDERVLHTVTGEPFDAVVFKNRDCPRDVLESVYARADVAENQAAAWIKTVFPDPASHWVLDITAP